MNLYESIKDNYKPNLVYVKDCRVDIDSIGNATVWKDGKILTQFKVPESIRPEEYREYLEYKLEDDDEFDYKSKERNESTYLEEGSLNSSVYTEIVRSIDDACAEEMDEIEIQLFLQNIINHCRDTAESYNVIVESEDFLKLLTEDCGEKLTEAPNPENAEVNGLIKKCLANGFYAKEHKDELADHGIEVDEVTYDDGSLRGIYLKGSNGRRLQCRTFGVKSAEDTSYLPQGAEDIKPDKEVYKKLDNINKYNPDTDDYENRKDLDKDFTLKSKSYKHSIDDVNKAKSVLPNLKRRLNFYERHYGVKSKLYRDLQKEITSLEDTIKHGIYPEVSNTLSDDIDYKNYINKPFISDRPHARGKYNSKAIWNEEPVASSNDGTEIDKANATSREYKKMKQAEKNNERAREEALRRDKEDQKRIEEITKMAAEEKAQRDEQISKADSKIKATLDEIHKKLEDSKAKKGK